MELKKDAIDCEHCEKQVPKKNYNGEYEICEDCIEDLPNKTGYCGMSCRLGFGCDDSC